MDRGTRLFLEALKDGRWHRKFPNKAITAKVVRGCLRRGEVEQKRSRIRGTRSFRVRFRITELGRDVLKGSKALLG